MAKGLSPLFSILRGSVAGLTFLANQYHQIVVRQKTAPVDPKTTPQSNVRSVFSGASSYWKNSLTPVQRHDWQLYAATCVYQGPVTNYTVTGRSMFIGAVGLVEYLKIFYALPLTTVFDAPTEPGFYGFTGFDVKTNPGPPAGIQVDMNNWDTKPVAVLISISPPQNPSRRRYKGPWDQSRNHAMTIVAASSGTYTFTGLVPGARYFVRVRAVVADMSGTPAMLTPEYIGNALSA